jgi:hypothetical protein
MQPALRQSQYSAFSHPFNASLGKREEPDSREGSGDMRKVKRQRMGDNNDGNSDDDEDEEEEEDNDSDEELFSKTL